MILCFSSFKGGTGKSALTIMLGNLYGCSGRRVLVIDLDHQMNTTRFYGSSPDLDRLNIAEALHREDLGAYITHSHIPGVDLLAGSMRILKQRAISPATLHRLLEPIRGNYDVVLIDTAPTLDNLVLNGWGAADRIVTPARVDGFDLVGLDYFREALRNEAPDKAQSWSVVLNFFVPPRGEQPSELHSEFLRRHPEILSPTVPETVMVRRAIHEGELITDSQRTGKLYAAIVSLGSSLMGSEIRTAGGF